MDPVITKILQGVPFSGMGTTQERNGLIGVIRNMIKDNKYTVDYILNYCESVGYSRQMAKEVFTQLTGLNPVLIIENNEYYNMPSYVPNMCIAWGLAKTEKDVAFYVVPWEYGYSVMKKDEINAPIAIVETATIPEAIKELQKVAKKIQTLDKIITEKLLEAEDVATVVTETNQITAPYVANPLMVLKKNFKDKVIDAEEFEIKASKMLLAEEITLDEAEDLMDWKAEQEENEENEENEESKDQSKEALEDAEEWNRLDAALDFETIYNEFLNISDEQDEEGFLGKKEKIENIFNKNKKVFKNVELEEAAERLYQLVLGFSAEEILGKSSFEKESSKVCPKCGKEFDGYPALSRRDNKTEICPSCGEIEAFEDFFNWDNKKESSKIITAENLDLEDFDESKDEINEELGKIEEKSMEELLTENTPAQYFEKELQDDKVDTINDTVSKCIDKFSEKFKDFDKYSIQVLSYNTKVLGDYTPNKPELVEDEEINANAILQIILNISNNADNTDNRKALAVFSIKDGKLNWNGTIRGENEEVVAFTEEGLDNLFEMGVEEEEELEDII